MAVPTVLCRMRVLPAWKVADTVWCRLAWLITLAVLLVGGRAVSAQPLGQQLLLWQQLQERASYHGSFVYERKGVFSTHEVWRQAAADGNYRERFLRLNGSRLEALRHNGQLACMVHARPGALLGGPAEPALPLNRLDLERLETGYHTEHIGRGRVAAREAAILLFTPRDIHRYPLEVHFDLDTGVVLKSLLLNEEGELLERFQFVSFTVGEQPDDALQVEGCQSVLAGARLKDAPALGWQAAWVPDGFVPVSERLQEQGGTSSRLFFDGLAHFSIFVTQTERGAMDLEHRQLGPTVVISRPMEQDTLHYMVTVLGEIPPATAQRIALSVSLDDHGSKDD